MKTNPIYFTYFYWVFNLPQQIILKNTLDTTLKIQSKTDQVKLEFPCFSTTRQHEWKILTICSSDMQAQVVAGQIFSWLRLCLFPLAVGYKATLSGAFLDLNVGNISIWSSRICCANNWQLFCFPHFGIFLSEATLLMLQTKGPHVSDVIYISHYSDTKIILHLMPLKM